MWTNVKINSLNTISYYTPLGGISLVHCQLSTSTFEVIFVTLFCRYPKQFIRRKNPNWKNIFSCSLFPRKSSLWQKRLYHGYFRSLIKQFLCIVCSPLSPIHQVPHETTSSFHTKTVFAKHRQEISQIAPCPKSNYIIGFKGRLACKWNNKR